MVSSLTSLCPKKVEDKSVLYNASICENYESNCLNVKDMPSSSVFITKNGRKIPIFMMSKIPTKKRSPVVYVRMKSARLTPMEKFWKQLLNELNEHEVKLSESSSEEEDILLFDNKNNFIADNEIGLGCILLNPDCRST
ncbi:uncharacterized protein LOC131604329 [Vicia villosa]|uniref:uncharacterized protein LOC131604329 n=1 Tax=Vicia villosa TaxID=3911 RepID=UPI00273B0F38|nr:uncharacterized protein LOC131604329 [Vicia villosa]